MSMAFESAELALNPLVRFSRGELAWAQSQREFARTCDKEFTSRLRWAAWLQRALFFPPVRPALLFLAARSARFWRRMFQRTR